MSPKGVGPFLFQDLLTNAGDPPGVHDQRRRDRSQDQEITAIHLANGLAHPDPGRGLFFVHWMSQSPQPPSIPTRAPHYRRIKKRNDSNQLPRGRRPMKKLVVGTTLLLLSSAAVAQTAPPQPAPPLPPGFANGPDTKWGGSDLPPGLSNENTNRDWSTPPGWSNTHSQGWQNGGGSSSMAGGPNSMGGGASSMGNGKGRGR
jgi:hypothetical protein